MKKHGSQNANQVFWHSCWWWTLTWAVCESQVHWRNITEAFLKPLFPFFLSFLLSFIHSLLSLRKRPENRFFQEMCHHSAGSGTPVSGAQRFASLENLELWKECWQFRPTLGGNRCSPSTVPGPLGQRGHPPSWPIKVRSQLPGVMSVSFPPRADLLVLGSGLNFSSDSYANPSSFRPEIAQ